MLAKDHRYIILPLHPWHALFVIAKHGIMITGKISGGELSMKRLFILLLALCLLCAVSIAETEGDFSYAVNDGKATITAYTGSTSDLLLPDTLGGYPVTSIGICAFRGCTSLTKVTIPDGVTRIGSRTFKNCTSLAQLHIPASVTRIDTHAFYGCPALRQLTLHDNIPQINILAFYGCSALRLCNPNSLTAYVLTDVGYSFTDPDHPQLTLKAFEDASGQRTFTVSDCAQSAVCVSFPERVTAIEKYAFFGCTQLQELIIPDSVTEIAYSAFAGCSALRQITLPGSIEKIADDAFAGCQNMTIIAPSGSAAQAFAQTNGLSWQAL